MAGIRFRKMAQRHGTAHLGTLSRKNGRVQQISKLLQTPFIGGFLYWPLRKRVSVLLEPLQQGMIIPLLHIQIDFQRLLCFFCCKIDSTQLSLVLGPPQSDGGSLQDSFVAGFELQGRNFITRCSFPV